MAVSQSNFKMSFVCPASRKTRVSNVRDTQKLILWQSGCKCKPYFASTSKASLHSTSQSRSPPNWQGVCSYNSLRYNVDCLHGRLVPTRRILIRCTTGGIDWGSRGGTEGFHQKSFTENIFSGSDECHPQHQHQHPSGSRPRRFPSVSLPLILSRLKSPSLKLGPVGPLSPLKLGSVSLGVHLLLILSHPPRTRRPSSPSEAPGGGPLRLNLSP